MCEKRIPQGEAHLQNPDHWPRDAGHCADEANTQDEAAYSGRICERLDTFDRRDSACFVLRRYFWPHHSIHHVSISSYSSSVRKKKTWERIPRSFNILAASLQCLINLSESPAQRGPLRRLTAEYYWHNPAPGDLFRPCRRELEHVCNRF
jgi:hypothetical protein